MRVAKRSKAALQRLEEARSSLILGLPVYESREGGGAAPPAPGGFRDVNKSRGEWDLSDRKPAPCAQPVAYIASWWHGSAVNPTQWVPLYAETDTNWIKRMTPTAIRRRLDAGEPLSGREKSILLESAIGL